MRTEGQLHRARSVGLVLFGCGALLLATSCPAAAAICGDTSGDGFVTSSDALATLKLAVGGGYDRRGDVMPTGDAVGDDKLGAGDALKVLKAAVEDVIPPCRGADVTRAAVSTAAKQFDSGGFAVVDIKSRTFSFRGGSIQRDSVVRAPAGSPVVINRFGFNTLQILDITKKTLPNVNECSVADGTDSNTQDVVLVSPSKGYVTPNAGGKLLVINPAVLFEPELDPPCSTIIQKRIDLSSFDSDGVPEMDQMVLIGTDLFVAMQLLDFPDAVANGRVAVIDTTTDTVKGSIALSFRNPFAQTKGLPYDEFQKRIFVGGPGRIGDSLENGGIEALDPATMQSAGMLITGDDIGAKIFDYVIVGTARAFAIVADTETNSVVELDLVQGKIREVLLTSTALISDIEMTELGELWVAYRGEALADPPDPPGLRIFRVSNRAATDEVELTSNTTPISLGQSPFTLAFF